MSVSKRCIIGLLGLLNTGFLWANPTSDDFNASALNTGLWAISDPVGDGTVSVNGTQLILSIPEGTSHDVWTSGNNALAVYQSIADTDIDVSIKFESAPSQSFQMQGIILRQSSTDFIRFDFYSDGVSMHAFRAIFAGGNLVSYNDILISTASELHMRIERVGNQWTYSYGSDGASWIAVDTFTHALSLNNGGPFIGNAGDNPQTTVVVDYFFDTNNPIVPEDGEVVEDTTPPTISGLTFTSGQDRVRAQWTTDEPAISTLSIEIPGGSVVGTANSIQLSNNHDLIVTGLNQDTTYDARLTSTDNSSNVSSVGPTSVTTSSGVADEPVIEIWYGDEQDFGLNGQPQNWANILGKVSDPDGMAALYYTLNGSASIALTIGPTPTRVHNQGDFNADIAWSDLNVGANTVEVTAQDSLGFTSVKSITVNKSNTPAPALPLSIDWVNESAIADKAQVVDGHWTIDQTNNGISTVENGYDRLVNIGDISWTDYEVTVDVTAHSLNPEGFTAPSWGPGLGILMRWTGHYDWQSEQPHVGWWPLGALAWVRWEDDNLLGDYNEMQMLGNTGTIHIRDNSKFFPLNVTHVFKMRVETPTGQGSIYQFKMWQKGSPEPAGWDMEIQESTSDPQNGSFLLVAHEVDATFGPVSVTPIGGGQPDNTPPIISGVNAAPNSTGATITWNTNEPATGIVRYGETTGYELGSSSSTLGTTHSVVVNGLAADTLHHFVIEATDPASNTSSTPDQTFTTTSGGGTGSGLQSDEFGGGALDTNIWTTVDPLSDGTFSVGGGKLSLGVPAGTSHDLWAGVNDVVRVRQAASDTDLQIELKFDSLPSQAYQIQGLVVEQDNSNLVRFDFYSDGSNLYLFSASFNNGNAQVRSNTVIPSNAPLYLRVTRTGDLWDAEYGYDGDTWISVTSFNHPLQVNTVAPFVGNAGGNAPAFTTLIDYFRVDGDTGAPDTTPPVITGPTSVPSESTTQVSWTTNEQASGLIEYGITTAYEIGSVVTSSGTAHEGLLTGLSGSQQYHYRVTATDGSGNFSQSADQTFTTTDPDTTAPVISNIQTTPLATSVTISWVTNELATSTINYGETTGYELGSINTGMSTNHNVNIQGLNPDQLHHFAIQAVDGSTNIGASGDQTFITDSASSGSGLVNDEFSGGSLNPMWTINDVVGDGVVNVTGGNLNLSVPVGTSHDIWTSGNDALRVTQLSSNTDFDVQTKFASVPTQQYQLNGLLIEQDANDLIRFDFYSDGSQLHVFSASFSNGSPSVRVDQIISPSAELHLRVNRTDDTWTGYYSDDGINWTQFVSFTHTITVARVGPFVGNAGPSPSFSAVVDYFRIN